MEDFRDIQSRNSTEIICSENLRVMGPSLVTGWRTPKRFYKIVAVSKTFLDWKFS